jgi:hypothetical protein
VNLTNLSLIQSKTSWAAGPGIPNLSEPPIEFDCFIPKLKILQWSSIRTTLNATFLKNLPPCLESLTLGDTTIDSSAVGQKFPDGLQTLQMYELSDPCGWIMGLNNSSDPIQLSSQANNLGNVALDRSGKEGDFDKNISDENQQLASWLRSYPLPIHLTTLGMEPPSKLNRFFISRLPRSLLTLSLRNNTIEDDNGIKELPPQLRRLNLRGDHPIQNNNVKLLPRSLTALELFSASDDEKLSDKCVSDLPSCLKVLALAATKQFTIRGVSALPRSIRSLSLGSIVLPEEMPFKTVFEAMQAIPPGADLHCRTTPIEIKEWALEASKHR